MNRLYWLKPPNHREVNPELGGTYVAFVGGMECKAEIELSPEGLLRGVFKAESAELEISGQTSEYSQRALGFLLEPSSKMPIAVFRAKWTKDGFTFELDVPNFEELIDLCTPERIVFQRVMTGFAPSGEYARD